MTLDIQTKNVTDREGLHRFGDPHITTAFFGGDETASPVFGVQEFGQGPITHDKANEIIMRYGLDVNKIKSGQPRKLSTSNIEIGFDPQRNTFYLRKY